jgi:hypothetical protein
LAVVVVEAAVALGAAAAAVVALGAAAAPVVAVAAAGGVAVASPPQAVNMVLSVINVANQKTFFFTLSLLGVPWVIEDLVP